jgi:hypothetical protein
MISLDNNAAGWALRRPVVTGKKRPQVRNKGHGSARRPVRAVTATAGMAGLNVPASLTTYPGACSRDDGESPGGPA